MKSLAKKLLLMMNGSALWNPAIPLSGNSPLVWAEAWKLAGLSDNDAVSTFTNFGTMANYIAAGGSRPIYKTNQINSVLPVLRFAAASSQSMSAAIRAALSLSLWVVVKSADANSQYGSSYGGSNNALIQNYAAGKWEWYNSPRTTIGNTSTSAYQIITTVIGSSSASADWAIGSNTGLASYWSGDLAAIVVYGVALNTADQSTVSNYLKGIYGL